MKLRQGFVSNSSSSSFAIVDKSEIDTNYLSSLHPQQEVVTGVCFHCGSDKTKTRCDSCGSKKSKQDDIIQKIVSSWSGPR